MKRKVYVIWGTILGRDGSIYGIYAEEEDAKKGLAWWKGNHSSLVEYEIEEWDLG